MKLRAVIVDDEEEIRLSYQIKITRWCPEIEIAGACASAEQAMMTIVMQRPNILFLDISMPGINGLELFRHLNVLDLPIQCIIISASDSQQYYREAIRLGLVDYLLKPLRKEELLLAVENVKARIVKQGKRRNMEDLVDVLSENRRFFETPTGGVNIYLSDIAYIRSAQRYTDLYRTDGTRETISKNITELETMLLHTRLVRVDRFLIVNTSHVEKLSEQLQKITFGKGIAATPPEITKVGLANLMEILRK